MKQEIARFVAWLATQDYHICWETNDSESEERFVSPIQTNEQIIEQFINETPEP